MIALFLLLVIAAMVLGIVGVVAKGLLYLLFIGIVVFLGALLFGALRMRRRPGTLSCSSAPSSSAPCGCGGDPAGARPGNSLPVTLDASVGGGMMILASRIAPVAGPAACGRRLRGCLRWSPAGPFMPALDGQHRSGPRRRPAMNRSAAREWPRRTGAGR